MKAVSTKTGRKRSARLILMAFALFLFLSISPKETFAAETLNMYTVKIDKGRLVMMSRPSSDLQYGVGELEKGDIVIHCPTQEETGGYWYVYAPEQDLLGYVKKESLKSLQKYDDGNTNYTVRVEKNYLALRNGKAYKWENEIGKMYTGDSVILLGNQDPTYWMVYSPLLKKAGYTNKNFLVKSSRYNEPANPETPRPVDPGKDQPEPAQPIVIPENVDAEWKAGTGHYLDFTFLVKNVSSKKTITSFVVDVYAQDSLGQRISEGPMSYTYTTKATIKPGGRAYAKSVALPYRDDISDVFAVIKKCTFSDGTTWVNKSVTEGDYTAWEIDD